MALRERFLKSEMVRTDLVDTIERTDKGEVLNFGEKEERPRYQFFPPREYDAARLDACISITVDQARKSWSDLRALVRVVGQEFVITMAGQPRAVLRRHPDFQPLPRVQRWVEERDARARRAQGSQPMEERIRAIEIRLDGIDRRLGGLKVEECDD